MIAELRRLKTENAEGAERERMLVRKRDETAEKMKGLEDENRRLRERKQGYKKSLSEARSGG